MTSLESENVVANAKQKLAAKKLDLIVAIIDRRGKVEDLPLLAKSEVAHRILDKVVVILATKQRGELRK